VTIFYSEKEEAKHYPVMCVATSKQKKSEGEGDLILRKGDDSLTLDNHTKIIINMMMLDCGQTANDKIQGRL
jgi:hypothetical protein